MNQIRGVLQLLLVLAAGFIAGCHQTQSNTTITMAHTLDEEHVVHKSLVFMAKRLHDISNGQMDVKLYSGGQLGNERELIELLQIGSLAMTKVSASPLEGFVPEMQVFSVPYLFNDHDHYWKVLNSPLGQQLLELPTRVGLRGLGYYDAGSRSFYTSYGSVNTPEDLDSKKIRVMKSQTAIKMVNTLGGAATPISWGELYSALQQGVVDGAENNPPTFWLSKHYEVCKFYALDEHTSVPDVLLISEKIWQSLPEQEQAWLSQAVKESVEFQRSLWAEATEHALEQVAKHGVTVVRPNKQDFIDAVAPLHQSYQGTSVGALISDIKSIR